MDHTTLNITAFRAMFVEFQSSTTYPDAVLNAWYSATAAYMDQSDNAWGMSGATLDLALQILTAHLLRINSRAGKGKDTGIKIAGSVDAVLVSNMAPPAQSGWQYWLASTPYGQQLWSLLSAQSVGGWTVGGGAESAAFRKVGGRF